jgi:DNA-binding HxlR family transcriptional regulator
MEKQTNIEIQADSAEINLDKEENSCPVTKALQILKGKYKLQIIEIIADQDTGRFGELRRKLDNVAQATLSAQLRELERDGILSREIFAETPPRVEYSLTHAGHSMLHVISELKKWNNDYCSKR